MVAGRLPSSFHSGSPLLTGSGRPVRSRNVASWPMPSRWKIVAVRSCGCDAIRGRVAAGLVAGAVHLAAADAGAGQGEAEHVPPVVAAAELVDLGRAAELADGHDQRFVQQPALVEVFDQRREADVEHRAEHVLQPVGILGVRVPQRVVDGRVARLARPADVDQPHAGLDQPPRQQHALPPAVLAVALADPLGLVANLKRLAGLRRRSAGRRRPGECRRSCESRSTRSTSSRCRPTCSNSDSRLSQPQRRDVALQAQPSTW